MHHCFEGSSSDSFGNDVVNMTEQWISTVGSVPICWFESQMISVISFGFWSMNLPSSENVGSSTPAHVSSAFDVGRTVGTCSNILDCVSLFLRRTIS